jgi:hypothetical protein
MSAVDELLAADAENAGQWRENFRKFDPSLPAAFDTAAEMFNTFSRCVEGTQDESPEQQILEQYGNANGFTAEEVVQLVANPKGRSSVPSEVRQAYVRMWARRARATVFLLLQRSYMWGATDLLRMRVTPAEGYCRFEAEAVGLMLLIREDPSVGDQWWRVASEEEGRAFFKVTQPKLKERLRGVNLASAYDHGSAAAQHVRVLSAVSGLSFSETHARLNYQEVREDDHFNYYLAVLSFLSVQVYVFRVLTDAFPEVTDPIWPQRVQVFINDVARLWDTLEKHFPSRCKAMRERTEREKSQSRPSVSS